MMEGNRDKKKLYAIAFALRTRLSLWSSCLTNAIISYIGIPSNPGKECPESHQTAPRKSLVDFTHLSSFVMA